MDERSLYHFCKCQYQLYEVPLRIYRSGKLVMKFDEYTSGIAGYEANRDKVIVESLRARPSRPVVFQTQSGLLLDGGVFSQDEEWLIYAGLVRPARVTQPALRRYFTGQGVRDLPEEALQQFLSYVNSLPIIAPGLFAVILSGLNIFLNDTIVEPRDIFEGSPEPGAGIEAALLSQREERYFGGVNSVNAFEMERHILFLVGHGMVRELKKLCEESAGFNILGDAANPDAWRISKDRCITGVSLVSRAAIAAGLPETEGLQMCDLYIQKAELCKTGRSLNTVRYEMLLDFTERVEALQFSRVQSRVVREASAYIMDHLEEKIALADLAQRFSVNKNYLCRLFRKEMGVGITEFTHRHKVELAKQLLRFTDKPLIEIANYLNFCSQSYFQKVFKELTGCTPSEYRDGKSPEQPGDGA